MFPEGYSAWPSWLETWQLAVRHATETVAESLHPDSQTEIMRDTWYGYDFKTSKPIPSDILDRGGLYQDHSYFKILIPPSTNWVPSTHTYVPKKAILIEAITSKLLFIYFIPLCLSFSF